MRKAATDGFERQKVSRPGDFFIQKKIPAIQRVRFRGAFSALRGRVSGDSADAFSAAPGVLLR